MKTLGLLNTTILTADGTFSLETITLDEAKALIKKSDEVLSAIGHQSTAEIMTELLEIPVEVNRIIYSQNTGDSALVFKMNGRPPEGVILNRKEIEEYGYSFKLLTKIS